jgi:hypothetical protein
MPQPHPQAHAAGTRPQNVRAVPTLDLVAEGAMPRSPVTLCPSVAILRTAARGQ